MLKNLDLRVWWLCLELLLTAAPARAFDPTENYETRQIQSWTVRVNKTLLAEDPPLAKDVLQLLDHQLYQITRVVPSPALIRLREVTIWVEVADPLFPGMCYHPNPEWLRKHDMNPAKAEGVEISNARNFLGWSKEQPWIVLHELAHSYHHRVLGFENPEIKAAYRRAVESKSYEKVLHINGQMTRHYALTDDQEYFAESTEAYFGTNDFYPFVRAELQRHDPVMFALLKKVWGVPAAPAATIKAPALQPPSTNVGR